MNSPKLRHVDKGGMSSGFLDQCSSAVAALGEQAVQRIEGCVCAASGLLVELEGLSTHVTVGDRFAVRSRNGTDIPTEIVGFRRQLIQAAAFAATDGIGPGSVAWMALSPHGVSTATACLPIDNGWVGRVIDPLGKPLDSKGPLPLGKSPRPLRSSPPNATSRARLGPRIDLGIRALDLFATCRQGQRLGLFAGSGVGKSTLLSMLARHAICDVAVLALIGERGREVREFLEDDLGANGLARSVVVVATSDQPPLMRREAAYAAMTVAEHFRDQGKNVLLMIDSLTRFCLSLREIGLAAGEPPTTRGYPPSVFAELPRLLERAGPGVEHDGQAGQISGLFTVLVEGDDHDEPIADAVRGILDGHVVLDRQIGVGGRYPAIDVLRSLSRSAPGCLSDNEALLIKRARALLSVNAEMADLVRLGAYKSGSDPVIDEALQLAPKIENLLRQAKSEFSPSQDSFEALRGLLGGRS
jgi:flagellum-specific ATP synthase